MVIFIELITTLLVGFLLFDYFTKDYVNPYKLIMIFGKKGAGKTTFLTKTAIKYIKQDRTVYSTIRIPGTIFFNADDIGKYTFKPDSIVLIDEVGMIWDNRNYKSFKPEVRDFFKLQRHYRLKIYLFSQSFDIDKKLRDLTDDMYLLTNKFRLWSVAKHIDKTITISKQQDEDGNKLNSTLVEDYKFTPFIFPGSRIITYIPRYAVFFDSHEAVIGEKIPGVITPFIRDTKKYLNRKIWRKDRRKEQFNKVKKSFGHIKQRLYILLRKSPYRLKIIGIYLGGVFIRIRDKVVHIFNKKKESYYEKFMENLKFEKQQMDALEAIYPKEEWDHRFDYLMDPKYDKLDTDDWYKD